MDNYNFGVIGNGKSAALISETGSIDWCCLPDFDSPSVFGRLLDTEQGGHFSVVPDGDYDITQSYAKKTNILCTNFSNGTDAFELIDFMPRYRTMEGEYHCPPDLIRYIRPTWGTPRIRFHYDPRLVYSEHETKHCLEEDYLKSTTEDGTYEAIYMYSNLNLKSILKGEPIEIEGECFVLISYNQKIRLPDPDSIALEFERTKLYWMEWVARTPKFGAYQNDIERSALVLKLFAYQKTGAILASMTTSLPETIGEVRNWDYRYCWLRDASMTIKVLTELGHTNAARRFLQFILDIIPFKDEKIQIMYGINGQRRLTEKELPWLAGYEGSKPVRIGNEAYIQKQNDIYGVVLDVIYQFLSLFSHTSEKQEDLWTVVRGLARHVRNNWDQPDRGIWEIRSEEKHFTFSKVLCWTAMDRAEKIAALLGKKEYTREWGALRDQIKEDIFARGWDEDQQAFTQCYGEKNLDAANLLMEYYGLIDANDPAYVSTVRRTYDELCRDGLMFRYRNDDDFGTPKSSFTVCTFWMIKSLYRIGSKKEAVEMFDEVLRHGNHVGLFSEDLDFETKRQLGNFPQAYSHLALIDTAVTIAVGGGFEE